MDNGKKTNTNRNEADPKCNLRTGDQEGEVARFHGAGGLDGLRGCVDDEHSFDEGFKLGQFKLAGRVA